MHLLYWSLTVLGARMHVHVESYNVLDCGETSGEEGLEEFAM